MSLEIATYIDRYRLNFPQIVPIDERYICVLGGTLKNTLDLSTPGLHQDDLDNDFELPEDI